MKEKKWFPVIYMFAVTAFFSSMVIGFTLYSSERVEANQQLAFEKAVLKALPGLYDENERVSSLQLHQRFTEKVERPDDLTAGAYTLEEGAQLVAYALPIEGQGFWAPVKGVIGIDADRQTITGIAFYEQNETPGLGAEITKPEFTQQFRGKETQKQGKPLEFKRPGERLDENSVHAVTGATQTCARLEKIINEALRKWQSQLSEKAGKI